VNGSSGDTGAADVTANSQAKTYGSTFAFTGGEFNTGR